jgi:hypothetical protein
MARHCGEIRANEPRFNEQAPTDAEGFVAQRRGA